MLPRPYMGSYLCEKGHQFLHKPWILALEKSVETFILVSIYDMPTIKNWQNLGRTMEKTKDKIPKEFRIGDTCFMSLATIGGNLFKRHSNNLNHVHINSNNLMSVITILGTNVHGGETFFYDEVNMYDIGKIAHVMNNSHGRCVVGPFDRMLY